MPYLNDHIRKPWVSANAGDEVWIVGDHGNVLIVKDRYNVRFSVAQDKLSDSFPDHIPALPETKVSTKT